MQYETFSFDDIITGQTIKYVSAISEDGVKTFPEDETNEDYLAYLEWMKKK